MADKLSNNIIKFKEATQLNAYLDSLDRQNRVEFIKAVAHDCDITRPVFYGWCYMCSRIPDFAKDIINNYAERDIFSTTP